MLGLYEIKLREFAGLWAKPSSMVSALLTPHTPSTRLAYGRSFEKCEELAIGCAVVPINPGPDFLLQEFTQTPYWSIIVRVHRAGNVSQSEPRCTEVTCHWLTASHQSSLASSSPAAETWNGIRLCVNSPLAREMRMPPCMLGYGEANVRKLAVK